MAVRPTSRKIHNGGITIEYRQLGHSGLLVSVLSLVTMTFGGKGKFAQVGNSDVAEARRHVDICLEAGVNFIDTTDVYSASSMEMIVGEVLEHSRQNVLLATKARFSMGGSAPMIVVCRAII